MKTPDGTVSPWYRERWPWLLMLGPFLVIVAGFITAWLAVRSSDGLVDDDYYKQGLAVNQRIHRDREALERGIEADLILSPDGRELMALLREKHERAIPPALAVRLSHPTVSGRDVILNLALGPDGSYRTALPAPLTGRWLTSVEDASLRWRLVGDWQPETMSALHLAPRKDVPQINVTKQGG